MNETFAVECLVCGTKSPTFTREFADALRAAHKIACPEHLVIISPILEAH